MRVSRAWLAIPVMALALTACGGTPTPSTDDSPAVTASATPGPTASQNATPAPERPEAPALDPSALPTPGKAPQGANAAPGEQIYDSSPLAIEVFWSWWRYEAILPEDWTRSPQSVYEDGIIVCASRARDLGEKAITETLQTHRGYQPAGAAAVYAAAVRGLCTHQNTGSVTDTEIGGYTTFFDRSVAQARAQILLKAPFLPGEIQPKAVDFGWFAKYACYHLGHSGTNGLMEYLVANSTMYDNGGGRIYLADSRYHTERDIEIYVVETAKAVCNGPTLFNEDWYR